MIFGRIQASQFTLWLLLGNYGDYTTNHVAVSRSLILPRNFLR